MGEPSQSLSERICYCSKIFSLISNSNPKTVHYFNSDIAQAYAFHKKKKSSSKEQNQTTNLKINNFIQLGIAAEGEADTWHHLPTFSLEDLVL